MEYLSYLIIAASAIAFSSFTGVQSRAQQDPVRNSSIFSQTPIYSLLFFLVCLITPLYFLYLDNNILLTILKTFGIYFLFLIVTIPVFKRMNTVQISLLALISLVITIVLVLIYFIIK